MSVLGERDRRDSFVCAALQGLCANLGMQWNLNRATNEIAEQTAGWAVQLADAAIRHLYDHPLSYPPSELGFRALPQGVLFVAGEDLKANDAVSIDPVTGTLKRAT